MNDDTLTINAEELYIWMKSCLKFFGLIFGDMNKVTLTIDRDPNRIVASHGGEFIGFYEEATKSIICEFWEDCEFYRIDLKTGACDGKEWVTCDTYQKVKTSEKEDKQ